MACTAELLCPVGDQARREWPPRCGTFFPLIPPADRLFAAVRPIAWPKVTMRSQAFLLSRPCRRAYDKPVQPLPNILLGNMPHTQATPVLEKYLRELKQTGRRALITFLPAGDPSLEATQQLLQVLARSGADVIEVGFPYSDPIADGPLIQAAYTRALRHGVRADDIFALVRDWCTQEARAGQHSETGGQWSVVSGQGPGVSIKSRPPLLVAMCSYSLVFRQGEDRFVERCQSAGFSGLIVPDLPVEESAGLATRCREAGLALVQLVTPTTPPHRARRIVECSSGFVYCVSVTGITGVRERLPEELVERLRWLRSITDLPLCVGFGVSRPEHARWLRDFADGIIVGSALVSYLEKAENLSLPDLLSNVEGLVRQLRAALDSPAAMSGTTGGS
jgi:tryptophan synthase alpha chain